MTQQWSLRRHVTFCVTVEFKTVLNSKKWPIQSMKGTKKTTTMHQHEALAIMSIITQSPENERQMTCPTGE